MESHVYSKICSDIILLIYNVCYTKLLLQTEPTRKKDILQNTMKELDI